MSGGGGEQAVFAAAAAQMARWYGLPNSAIAGASDAKIADAQSGYEKALTVAAAAQAGCNRITQAAGMQAGLMAASFEAYVIDDDMLGHVLSLLRPVSGDAAAAVVDEIDRVVRGEGHFLGQPQTLARMERDFFYPKIGDRRSPEDWEAAGSRDQRDVARDRAWAVLAEHFPAAIDDDVDQALRVDFDIRLPREAMRAG